MSRNIWTPGASIIPSGMLGECMPWHSFFFPFFFLYLWKHLIGCAARTETATAFTWCSGMCVPGMWSNPVSGWQGMGEGVCGVKYF